MTMLATLQQYQVSKTILYIYVMYTKYKQMTGI